MVAWSAVVLELTEHQDVHPTQNVGMMMTDDAGVLQIISRAR